MKKYLGAFIFAVLLFGAEEVFACSCLARDESKLVGQTVSEDFRQATAVFTGRVLQVGRKNNAQNVSVKLAVQKRWKGKISNEVKIITAADSAACGFNFEVGNIYLVYAAETNGKLSTNICSRTAQVGA